MRKVRPRHDLREFRPRPRSEGMDFGLDKCLRGVRASTGSLTVQSLYVSPSNLSPFGWLRLAACRRKIHLFGGLEAVPKGGLQQDSNRNHCVCSVVLPAT